MPIGIICNSLAIVIGGVLGALLGSRLSEGLKNTLNMIFALCAMSMGVTCVILMENMPACVFSIIVGTIIGRGLRLTQLVQKGGTYMQRAISRISTNRSDLSQDEYDATLLTIIVLFCVSGTGFYGSMYSAMSGDHSILIAKAILDIFTALIFACSLGLIVSFIALPQFIIFMTLFLVARWIYPLTTPVMIHDFKAVGGMILLATSLRMMKLKMFDLADMIPAMFLIFPVSGAWTTYILPMIAK